MGNGAIAGSVVIARRRRARNRILQAFREAGATSPQNAQPIRDDRLLRGFAGVALARLAAAGVIRQTKPGHFYLDEAALAEYEATRRQAKLRLLRMAALALTIFVIGAIAFLALGGR